MQGHRYRKSRIPKDSRTIPIYGDPIRGDGNDDGKYYKCWNCGFVCNVDRDALGDGQSRDGVAIKEFIEIAYGGLPSSFAVLGSSIGHFHVALEKGADGTAKTIEHNLMAKDGSGCPLCQTLNWKGDH